MREEDKKKYVDALYGYEIADIEDNWDEDQ